MLLSSAPPNRSSSLPWRLFFCIPYLPNTKPSVFYSVFAGALYASIMPHTGSLVKDFRSRRCPGFLLFGFLLLLSDPDQTLYPKIDSVTVMKWMSLFDDHQLTFRCQIWSDHLYFPPRHPFTSGSKFVYTFRCHRDRLFLSVYALNYITPPFRRKCL